MGVDCSKCQGTIQEEKILMMDNCNITEKTHRPDPRKEKVNPEKTKSSFHQPLKEIIDNNPKIIPKLIKLQSLIRKYKDRRFYKIILRKTRLSQNYFSQEEQFETLSNSKKLNEQADLVEQMHEYKTGAIYSGKWLGGFRHGKGLMKWSDGTYYEGEWNLGFAEGKGMLVFVNGDYMKGQFRYNKLNGYGECYNTELSYEYKGYWENDMQTGQGQEIWPDGSEYVGLYALGKKDGFGKYSWVDGSFYIGEWKDNKINGLGVYHWADGRKFVGEWQNSKMNGYGTFFWRDGRTYRGEYLNDKKHGYGIYDGAKGKKYEGYWAEGVHSGLGKYTKADDSFKIGFWEDTKITDQLTNENEIAEKLEQIDNLSEECVQRVDVVMLSIKNLFENYLPNVEFEVILSNSPQ